MSVLDRAQQLFRAGRKDEAAALVEAEAKGGDAEAQFALANWRLFALHGPRDLAAAHAWFAAAAGQGHVEAQRSRAYLTASGTGVAPDPKAAAAMLAPIRGADAAVARQLDFLPRMQSEAAAQAAPRESLSQSPRIELVRGLMSAAECAYVMELAGPALRPSFVVDPRSGARMPHPVRTSFGMSFGPTQEDLVIAALNRRLAAATGTGAECGEPLHVLRYAPGQEYRPHMDALPGAGNQRTVTALLYLNDGYRGGETEFPELGLKVRGAAGDVLVFANLRPDGRPDPRARHAGLPIEAGEKWLATRWIRSRRHDPFEA